MTIEPAISTNQLAEMRDNQLQLVIPASLHDTYPATERPHILNVADFITVVRERQKKGTINP